MREVDIKMKIKEVERTFKVDLTSENRYRKNVYLRAILIQMIYNKTEFSLEKIGSFFNRDHATVIHALKLYDNNIKYSDFLELKDKIYTYEKTENNICKPCTYYL